MKDNMLRFLLFHLLENHQIFPKTLPCAVDALLSALVTLDDALSWDAWDDLAFALAYLSKTYSFGICYRSGELVYCSKTLASVVWIAEGFATDGQDQPLGELLTDEIATSAQAPAWETIKIYGLKLIHDCIFKTNNWDFAPEPRVDTVFQNFCRSRTSKLCLRRNCDLSHFTELKKPQLVSACDQLHWLIS